MPFIRHRHRHRRTASIRRCGNGLIAPLLVADHAAKADADTEVRGFYYRPGTSRMISVSALLVYRLSLFCCGNAAPGRLVMPPRPEAADEQRIDDLIAQHLSHHKLEVLKQSGLVRLNDL